MQPPNLTPLQSSLLVQLLVTLLCFAASTPSASPRFAYASEVFTTHDHDPLHDPEPHALTGGGLAHVESESLDNEGTDGYVPDFAYLDRSIIGRQAEEVEELTNNEKIEKDIGKTETLQFKLDKSQLRLKRAVDVSLEALEAQGTGNDSGESGRKDVAHGGKSGALDDEESGGTLDKRQTGSHIWLTANTCRQPQPNGNLSEMSPDHPQLVMYVSTSQSERSGSESTDVLPTNITVFDSGYAILELNATSDIYVNISAPNFNDDEWFGSWHFELAASVDGPYHNYNESDPFLFMIDTDSESTLFITYDLDDSNRTEDVEKWRKENPFKMYAFPAGDWSSISGMEHSYCALKEQFNVNTTKNFTIDTSVTTKFSGDDFPKAQFHVQGLDTAKTYNGFVVVEGSQEPLDIPGVGTVRGGGRVFQAFNWTTKADDSCQVLFDLEFCDQVAYAVPSSSYYKLNDSALATLYDQQARKYYDNFNKSLAQVACDTTSEAQYSLARTCADCERDYKNWLCLVLIPRCEDWTADGIGLQPRNINVPFPNGSLPFDNNVTAAFNESHRDRFAFSQSRNPMIDEAIKPGPYKEMKPCEDLCFDVVKSCPAQLGFACPNSPGRESAYGVRDENPDTLTCNFPGAVVKLNAESGVGVLGVRWGSLVLALAVAVALVCL